MATHKITTTRSGSHPTMGDWDAEYEITFTFRKGSPDYYNKAGGHWEQGYDAEVEVTDVRPEYGSFDARAKAEAMDWAQEWLSTDGYDQALEVVASDTEAAREFAADLRADR